MKKTLLFTLMILIMQLTYAQTKKITGFYKDNIAGEFTTESSFDSNISTDSIGKLDKKLSDEPHSLGSPADKEKTQYILSLFRRWGWDADIETFYVLFPTPKTRLLEMTSPVKYKAVLKEPALKEDATSGQKGQLPTYNAYSADGDVTAQLVYVNYGLPEDYEVLDRMGISVKGKIVIARYGRSWRGIKPKVAQEHGAVGCLIYSDPEDDGYFQGDIYPKGSYRNEYGVQRGSVVDMSGYYPGDPLTPGIGATKDAKRLNRDEAPSLLKIPVLPISYHDAAPLLKALDGPVVPVSWHGGLPFAYHFGPGKATVHLKLEFNWDLVPCYDVIAKIEGAKYPDEWVLRGNHEDAWVNGAGDPISGQATLLEEARSIGLMLKKGWRPDRTIIYCAWDGEEPGLLGSTEWVEEHLKELQEKAVVYINTDANGRGFLFAQGSPTLETLVDEISKQVVDPQTGVSVFDRRRAHDAINARTSKQKEEILNRKKMEMGALGSGSDYSSFVQHAGIPSLNLGYGGEDGSGAYHSIYDSYDLYTRFIDPGFVYCATLAKTIGHAVLRMAGADILPFDYSNLYKTASDYSEQVMNLLESSRENTLVENMLINTGSYAAGDDPTKGYIEPKVKKEVPFLDFAPLQNALQKLNGSVDNLERQFKDNLESGNAPAGFNRLLYRGEQELLAGDGLPRRPWYRNILYAPGYYTGYGVKTLPGIREAIEQHNWDEAQQQIKVDAEVLEKLAGYLRQQAVSSR